MICATAFLPAQMIQAFAALLLAHLVADFLLQSTAMAAAKQARQPRALMLHGVIVLATATLAIAPHDAGALPPLLLLTLVHLLIDWGKSFLPPARLGPFLADQAAHLVTLGLIAWAFPVLAGSSLWAGLPAAAPLMALAAGLILATQAGRFAIAPLMASLPRPAEPDGLTGAGTLIGLLERGLIYIFVMAGQPTAIGFLIAAKSILRFEAARKAGEYVITGTLASFGWALLCAYGTLALLSRLPDLGIPALNH